MDGNLVGRLDVGLIEAGEDTLGIGGFELGVHVHLVICRILEPVKTLARGGVEGLRHDRQFVTSRGQIVELQTPGLVVTTFAVTGQGQRQDVLAIQFDRGDFLGAQVYECGPCLCGSEGHGGH